MADWEVLQPAAKKNSTLMADWEGLSHDILALILRKVILIEDFIAFGTVCKSWHEVFASNKRSSSRPQIPWLMLPEKKGEEDHHLRIFRLSKQNQNILRKNLYIPDMSDKRCIGLNYGWVLTISRNEGEMSLVHPLSKYQIKLPPQRSIPGYGDDDIPQSDSWLTYGFIENPALSADPLESPSDFVLMILHCGFLGYWRSGDREWSRVELFNIFCDITYYQNEFYAIDEDGEVWSCKVSSHEHVVARQIIQIPTTRLVSYYWPYIVGNAETLLVLARQQYEVVDPDGGINYCVAGFQVYELDLINGVYKQITNIGDRAIFIGYNSSISLDGVSQFPGVKSNHIYYVDTREGGDMDARDGRGVEDMGTCDVQNGQIMPLVIEESSSLVNRPFWFIPSL